MFRFIAVVLVSCIFLAAEDKVRIEQRDLDGDGAPEYVLSNGFLEVELMSGALPPPVRPGKIASLFGKKEEQHVPAKYSKRFSWGGWIGNIRYRPSGRRWFKEGVKRPQWHGIPEEFGQAVNMGRNADGTFTVLKLGIGVCTSTAGGHCLRGGLTLKEPAPWTVAVQKRKNGGRSLVFTQQVRSGEFAYVYTKCFTLEPGSNRLVVNRRLLNTGERAIHSTWYTHGFWGQVDNDYDENCWVTLPIKELGGSPAGADTARCFVPKRKPAFYWGSIGADEIAEPWYASGYAPTRETFLSQFSEDLAWFRVWSHEDTYSVEPFLLLDIEPGECREWTTTRSSFSEMDSVRACGEGGAFDWQWQKNGDLEISFAAFRVQKEMKLKAEMLCNDAGDQSYQVVKTAGYSAPYRPLRLILPAEKLKGASNTLSLQAVDEKNRTLAVAKRRLRKPAPAWKGRISEGKALVLANVRTNDETGEVKHSVASGYLNSYLGRAGFSVETLNPKALPSSFDFAEDLKLVVLAGGEFPTHLVDELEGFVRAGGGLLVCAPVNLRTFEFSELLPVTQTLATVNVQELRPRDGTRDFLSVSPLRYGLEPVGSVDSLFAGIPFAPLGRQGIAQLQVVKARKTGNIILRYHSPAEMSPKITSPALTTSEFGKGRVAFFASPIDWGNPSYWVFWSRLGEYHESFFARLSLWLGGGCSDK